MFWCPLVAIILGTLAVLQLPRTNEHEDLYLNSTKCARGHVLENVLRLDLKKIANVATPFPLVVIIIVSLC